MKKVVKWSLIIILGLLILFDIFLFSAIGSTIKEMNYYSRAPIFGPSQFIFGDLIRISTSGRMIAVKVEKYVPGFVYGFLAFNLKIMDIFSSEIGDVYRNQGGTITIDCRTFSY